MISKLWDDVKATVRMYRGGAPVAWTWEGRVMTKDDPGKAVAYCGHNHRDPDHARVCARKLLRRAQATERATA